MAGRLYPTGRSLARRRSLPSSLVSRLTGRREKKRAGIEGHRGIAPSRRRKKSSRGDGRHKKFEPADSATVRETRFTLLAESRHDRRKVRPSRREARPCWRKARPFRREVRPCRRKAHRWWPKNFFCRPEVRRSRRADFQEVGIALSFRRLDLRRAENAGRSGWDHRRLRPDSEGYGLPPRRRRITPSSGGKPSPSILESLPRDRCFQKDRPSLLLSPTESVYDPASRSQCPARRLGGREETGSLTTESRRGGWESNHPSGPRSA
jgi:hypothetical protein